MTQSPNLLLIFVKHPEVGKSKTRLAVGIGHEKALKVYQKLLAFTRDIADQVLADKAVFYGNQMPQTDLWSEIGYPRLQQTGQDLGERMENAFQWGFAQGYQRIILMGSDCAQLTVKILNQGFEMLKNNYTSIGPAKDGGYYLIGMQKLISSVFYHKKWSTDTVFEDTIKDFERGQFSYSILPILSDVDTIDDLKNTFLEEFL